MEEKIYKYYLVPSSGKYVRFTITNGISLYNVVDANTDKELPWLAQDGSTDLEVYELIEVGRAIERHRFVQSGQAEYDPYFLWPQDIKKVHLQ